MVIHDSEHSRPRQIATKTYTWPEVFAFPLLHSRIGLEVIEVLKIEAFILAVEFCRTFLSALDNSINVVVDEESDWQ
jgi:hypothetical protein